MKLPNAENAVISEDKLVGYLLDLGHRRGGSKANLLYSLGYDALHWEVLEHDLRLQHLTADVIDDEKRSGANGTTLSHR